MCPRNSITFCNHQNLYKYYHIAAKDKLKKKQFINHKALQNEASYNDESVLINQNF